MESWFYDIAWEPFSNCDGERDRTADAWLVIGPPGGSERESPLLKELSERGGTAVFVEVDTRDVGKTLLMNKLVEQAEVHPHVTGVISLLSLVEAERTRFPRPTAVPSAHSRSSRPC